VRLSPRYAKSHRILNAFGNEAVAGAGNRHPGESQGPGFHEAGAGVGESIRLYEDLKRASCSPYVNEHGLSRSDFQVLTDHARPDALKSHARSELVRMGERLGRGKVGRPLFREFRQRNGNEIGAGTFNDIEKIWRKCMGIEPTADVSSAGHWI